MTTARKLPRGVRRLPSGRYQARHVGPDGIRRAAPVTFATRTDAKAWLDDQDRATRTGSWRDPRAGQVSFDAYASLWLQTRTLTPRTRAEYRKLLSGHLSPAFGAMPLRLITPVMVRDWYAGLDTGPTRKAHAYALLRTILNTAVADDAIAANPCRVRGAGTTRRAKQVRPATLAELGLITDAMRSEYQPMVLLAAWCGLRFGELAELRRKDIDAEHGRVRVRRGVTHVDGTPVVGRPKTDAGIRDVSIPPHCIPVLKQHLREHVGAGRDALLFPAPTGGHLRSDSRMHVEFRAAREAAGRPDLRFHDLRHTGATLAAATGATLAELMRRLGHANPAAAMRYQHAADDRDKAIAAALSEFHAAKVVTLRPKRKTS
jgi:integrase